MKRLLILYCSPSGHDRLRIDKEHQAIDRVIRELKIPVDQIVRKQAATFDDVLDAIGEDEFDVIQFSGHGDEDCLLLDSASGDAFECPISDLVEIISRRQPNLRLFISLSCFSYSSTEEFLTCSPHVICIQGEADDDACVVFIERFYKSFFRTPDIRNSYCEAYETVRKKLEVIHSVRSTDGSKKIWVDVVFGFHCLLEVLVDLSEAQEDIAALGESRDQFLGTLVRKLKVHRDIFATPRDRAYIAIGDYIGQFSWVSRNDVRCHGVFTLREDLDEQFFYAWGSYSVAYYDCTLEKYRAPGPPPMSEYPRQLEAALKHYLRVFDTHFRPDALGRPGRALMGNGYAFSQAQIEAALREAEVNLESSELGLACSHLEAALSGMHDVMDRISAALIAKPMKAIPPPDKMS
jgi:hypothetical protein